MKYVKVIIDNTSNHTDTFYTYACSFDDVTLGACVRVPFGRGNRLKKAYVFEVMDENEALAGIDASRIKRCGKRRGRSFSSGGSDQPLYMDAEFLSLPLYRCGEMHDPSG